LWRSFGYNRSPPGNRRAAVKTAREAYVFRAYRTLCACPESGGRCGFTTRSSNRAQLHSRAEGRRPADRAPRVRGPGQVAQAPPGVPVRGGEPGTVLVQDTLQHYSTTAPSGLQAALLLSFTCPA